ncbi:uncharacterized protein DS421_4g110870 [Arachis hypogaea]|nr:uncharacterized protein DS421_4g110870 [Arachis hypogaea]
MPEEEEDSPSPPHRHSPPPRCSIPHPSGHSQRSKRPILHDTREPPNLDSLDFKNKYGAGVSESAKRKKAKSSKTSVLSESEDESLLPETSDKTRFSETVNDVLTEFSNMSNLMVKSYKEARKQAFENEKA